MQPRFLSSLPITRSAIVIGIATAALAVGAVEFSHRHSAGVPSAHGQVESPVNQAVRGLPNFVGLAKKVGGAVVNVSTTSISETSRGRRGGDENDPMNEFLERFFGGQIPRGPQRRGGVGSGFIIDSDGTILTNYHVIDGAQKINVTLSDGESYEAQVVGKDQKTDIAMLKIEPKKPLTAVRLGDSDNLEVGEWVMAIGNPFGLDHTVTSGIVSAKGRNIGAGPYDSFIQTDASINPGNSGGPLLNLRGEVVGINTAIFSQSGGNIGIGFAIPTNLVKDLLPQLKDKGRVVRGFIGATIQKVTPEIAESLKLKEARGALVSDVTKGAPADKAGIRAGDVITEFNDMPIKDSADLPIHVARVAPKTTVQIKVIRDSKESSMPITVGELSDKEVVAAVPAGDLGMAVQPLTPGLANSLGVDRAEGVVITSVTAGSPAEEAGLRRGDVVSEINRRPIKTMDDYNSAVAKVEKGKSLLFLIKRGEGNLFLALKP